MENKNFPSSYLLITKRNIMIKSILKRVSKKDELSIFSVFYTMILCFCKIKNKNKNSLNCEQEYILHESRSEQDIPVFAKLYDDNNFEISGCKNKDIANELLSNGAIEKGLLSKKYIFPVKKLGKICSIISNLQIDKDLKYAHRCCKLYEMSFSKEILNDKNEIDGMEVKLYDFQYVALSYALLVKKCIIGDEAGVGKTFPAIALGKIVNKGPVVVVCPANLKLNWRNEIIRAFPGDSVYVCYGRSASRISKSNWIIINYDIISDWARYLNDKFKVIIFDEIHNCKNPNAKRTIACKSIAINSEYCIGLTGTMFRNRVYESKTQLEIISKLDEAIRVARFKKILPSKCSISDFFDLSPKNINDILRSSCYIRREKRDVISQLPCKTRSTIFVDINNRRSYEFAETEAINYIKSIQLKFSEKSTKMHIFSILNNLRQEAGIGKVPAIIDWINDFLTQTDEKLVVFAYHRAVQSALIKAFPKALSIIAVTSQQERDAAIIKFQNNPEERLVICSLNVASEGITLTAASTLLSVELDYVPAKLFDQMEGRIDRLGQTKPMQIYYAIGAGTIDERMIKLLKDKWKVVSAGNIGIEGKYEINIFNELVIEYNKAI